MVVMKNDHVHKIFILNSEQNSRLKAINSKLSKKAATSIRKISPFS